MLNFRNGSFAGTLTVPGVFTAELEKTSYTIMFWADIVQINFEIVAKENGKEFRVRYNAVQNIEQDSRSGHQTLNGTATLEDDTILGTFVAIKIKEEN